MIWRLGGSTFSILAVHHKKNVGLHGSMDIFFLDTVIPNVNVTSDFPQRVVCPTSFHGVKC